MMISTRGKYAINVMLDLAKNGNDAYIPLKDIAIRQNVSQKYVSSIMAVLSKSGFVDAVHGKGGGYKLSRKTHEYTIGSILKLTENSMAPVSCLEKNAEGCERAGQCVTLPIWINLQNIIDEYLENITLLDLINNTIPKK